jgi:radical SAM superfamily enzyme YgiQ (UPF0313 family)
LCNGRGAVRTCAIIAASGGSGRVGDIATRGPSQPRSPSYTAATAARALIVFDLADENPTTSKRQWRVFLEALIGEQLLVLMLATIRADDIVRDADILHLYKKAGITRILLGLDNTDEETLRKIRKGNEIGKDREAIRLLRRHKILSMVSYIAAR